MVAICRALSLGTENVSSLELLIIKVDLPTEPNLEMKYYPLLSDGDIHTVALINNSFKCQIFDK
jgi:hypothetical protein